MDMLTPEAKDELKECTTFEAFLAFAKKPGNVAGVCFCELHREKCNLLKALLHIAGIICVSWSPMGAQKGTAGLDFILFVAWVCCRRSLQEQLFVDISLTIRRFDTKKHILLIFSHILT